MKPRKGFPPTAGKEKLEGGQGAIVLAKSRQISNIDGQRICDPLDRWNAAFLKEEQDVCRKNNLGNNPFRRVHDVYLALLLYLVHHHSPGTDHLL